MGKSDAIMALGLPISCHIGVRIYGDGEEIAVLVARPRSSIQRQSFGSSSMMLAYVLAEDHLPLNACKLLPCSRYMRKLGLSPRCGIFESDVRDKEERRCESDRSYSSSTVASQLAAPSHAQSQKWNVNPGAERPCQCSAAMSLLAHPR